MHYRISFIFVTFISLFCFALPGVAQDANTDESRYHVFRDTEKI